MRFNLFPCLLSKAVKMNPMLSDAWNELGECYYKGGQADKALNCFQCVLKHVQDKVHSF